MIGFLHSEKRAKKRSTIKPALVAGQHRRVMNQKNLKDLFEGIEIVGTSGTLDAPVTGLITDSRRVVPGSLFFAIPGLRTDGSLYIEEAIDRGATAVVSENHFKPMGGICHIQVPNVRAVLAKVSRLFYDMPDEKLALFGVTGTNGKTTVTMLTQYLLESEPGSVGLLGTIHYDLGARTLPAFKTTPESVDIYGMLEQMHLGGCKAACMEVSSHAIDQLRVLGLKLDVAAFLNLTQDHIDYHKTMESYFEVKSRMFTGGTGVMPEAVAINIDDPYGARLARQVNSSVRTVTFGRDPSATIRAENIDLAPECSQFEIVWPEGCEVVRTQLPGLYNISNVLAALAMLYAGGYDIQKCVKKVVSFPGVPGRMERVDAGQDFQVFVDYAHTDDALNNALKMLRDITPGRLLVVFGCGGNRDRDKRPRMTSVAQRYADYSWATADNPRKEALESIFADMQKGVARPDSITFVEDRRRAIGHALEAAKAGDTVLIAGKGHETYQEFAESVVPFDDRQVCRELLGLQAYRKD